MRPNPAIVLLPLACALALSACGPSVEPEAGAAQPPPDAAPGAAMEAADAPPPLVMDDDVPHPGAGRADGRGQLPAPGVIGFGGFGPAAFGDDAESVRMAWGRDLGDAQPDAPGGCYMLQPTYMAGDAPVAFMIEGDRFVRLDVRVPGVQAPGGGEVGMAGAQLQAMYPAGLEQQPHKYVAGASTLRATDPDGGEAALVFETDAQGMVTQWRIGMPPQVDYVERCG